MKAIIVLAALAPITLSACSSLSDSLSAHSDRVARAGSAELDVNQLATLLGNSKALLRKDIAKSMASVWVDYQLLGVAAARNDSLNDPKLINEWMWPAVANLRMRKLHDVVGKSWGVADTADAKRQWEAGQMLAADQILLVTQGMTDAQKAAVRKRADAIRASVTPANFAATATASSEDHASAPRGGSLGVFRRGAMVPEFEKALLALRPGGISPLIQTQYGYLIIHRPTYEQIKPQLALASKARSVFVAESTYLAKLERNGHIEVKKGAVVTVRAIGNQPEAYRRDSTLLATSTAGPFTTARLVGWLETLPPQAGVMDQIKQAPDTFLVQMIRNFVRNELVLKQADSARIKIDSAELAQLRAAFMNTAPSAWAHLGVTPQALADSAKNEGDREKLAAKRVDEYFKRMVAEQAPFVAIPAPALNTLRDKYGYSFNEPGFDRAVEAAAKIRNTTDSLRSAQPAPVAAPSSPTQRVRPTTSSTPSHSNR